MLNEYAEEIIFVLFFTLSARHLDFKALSGALPLVGIFVVLRAVGKTMGAVLGGRLSGASSRVRRYVAAGLIPQGGIVIGLALMIHRAPSFAPFADRLVSVVIGATIVHELAGPVLAKIALTKAGEVPGH